MSGNDDRTADLVALRHALVPLFGDLSDEAVGDVAASGDWIDIEGGKRLIRFGEEASAVYLVVRGRLCATVPREDGSPRVVGEVSRGEAVGEMALLGGGRRNANIDAIRDSRLLRLDVEAFHALTIRHPDFLWNLARLVVRRIGRGGGGHRRVPAVHTIAVIGVGPVDRTARFVDRLVQALAAHGETTLVGIPDGPERGGLVEDPRRRADWLDGLERRARFVVLAADPADPDWTGFVVRQADRVLVVAPGESTAAEADVPFGRVEDDGGAVRTRRELVLLHPDGSGIPRGTAGWLDAHDVARVHHVREDREDDHLRVARFLAGRAVAVVLAGGGAKGFTHVGVVRALREHGMPVDLVGGTSIGAILAATIAEDWDVETQVGNIRGAFVTASPASDYQIPPIVSLIRGRSFARLLRRYFGEIDIEDLWVPFFCVSSNLTASEKAVHTRGRLWKALRASASIAGVFPPVVVDGQLHVDGGTFDNLPVDTAIELDAGHVIACDIDRPTHGRLDIDSVPSQWTLLADRFLRRRRYRVPGLINTMMQASFLAGLERARASSSRADLFLEANARGIRFLDWNAFDRAERLGYEQAREWIADPAVRDRLEAIRRPGDPSA